MVIFLYGADDYRRQQKKEEIVSQFFKKHSGFGFRTFDFEEEETLSEFLAFVHNQSIFDSVRLAVVENFLDVVRPHSPQAEKEFVAELKTLLPSRSTTVLLIVREKRVAKPWAFLLDNPVVFQEFEYLSGTPWKHFIRSQAKALNLALDETTLSLLSQVYQDNTWGLVTELEKLSTLGSRTLCLEDLAQFHLEVAPDFWRTVQGLKSYDISRRLFALETLFARNEPPAKLFNLLSSLWKEKIPQSAGLDVQIKSGKLDYEDALLDLAIS